MEPANMEPIVSFGCWLMLRRKALRLTRDELARRVDYAAITIRKIETDERRPSRKLAERLAEHVAIPWGEREVFLRAARGELRVERLPVPAALAHAPSPTASGTGPASLPISPTPLIGRAGEVAAIRERLLHADVHLLTLTGAPGVGKTRLSLQVAADMLDTFPHGVGFIPLASISDPRLVISAVALALGVAKVTDEPLLQRLGHFLRTKHLLLVLDNFEQVVQAGPDLAELLAAAPRLKILVTSRTALRLSGEHLFAVPPLPVPDLSQLPPDDLDLVTALGKNAAVELFVQRARAASPGFSLSAETARSIAAICAQLDGLPLAIELAAGWCRLFTPRELLTRLDRRFALLTRGAVDASLRHRTLRQAVDWSYDLLDAGEQILFRRLGVFLGGCTFAAVEAVCQTGGNGTESTPLHEGLTVLLDTSLLERVEGAGGETRFRMLETIREYALERLDECGEVDGLRRLHASYYLAVAETAESELHGAEQEAWLARLDVEHDNLRAALAWAEVTGDVELGLRLAGGLWPFWWMRGFLGEGRQWLASLRARPEAAAPTPARAKALLGEGTLAQFQGDFAAARALHEESLAISRAHGDKRGVSAALNGLAGVTALQGDIRRAVPLFEESLTLARQLGCSRDVASALNNLGFAAMAQGHDRRAEALFEESLTLSKALADRAGSAWALSDLGWVAQYRGDYPAARSLYEASLVLQRELGDKWGAATSLNHLANVALAQRDHQHAAALFYESLALYQSLEDRWGIAWTLAGLGRLAHLEEDSSRASALYRQGLALFHAIGHQWGLAVCLVGLAGTAAARQQPDHAARLFGAAEALRGALGEPPPTVDRDEFEHALAAARANRDEAGFAVAWEEGRVGQMQLIGAILGHDSQSVSPAPAG